MSASRVRLLEVGQLLASIERSRCLQAWCLSARVERARTLALRWDHL